MLESMKHAFLILLSLFAITFAGAQQVKPPLANEVILIIRHAEKPEEGTGLTPIGVQRANAYVDYFRAYRIDGQPAHLDHLIATADTKKSFRERLTLEPLGKALGQPLDIRFKTKNV